MDEPANIWCGPDKPLMKLGEGRCIILSTHPSNNNVHLLIENISSKLVKNPPPLILDLLEVASYVYVADQCVRRGGSTLPGDGRDWRREFTFHIPVRCLDIWNRRDVQEALTGVLQFVSDDFFEFKFRLLTRPPQLEDYFDFDQGKPWFSADEVMLFSGGLDSFAALCEAVHDRTGNIILVSHRSAPQTDAVQRRLLEGFVQTTGSLPRLLHVPVWVNKSEHLTRDTHQRTRSFLYASLATALAKMHELDRLCFYENGITSSNLSISQSVVGARASRTTHPRTLAGFGKLFSLLFDRPFHVGNPFFWKTKADVVKEIKDRGLQNLIRFTTSCSHIRSADRVSNHCGLCSQCVGRRLAILYNSLEAEDPEEMYKTRLPLDPMSKESERAMVELIIKAGRESLSLDPIGFFTRFAQANAVVPFLGLNTNDAANRLYELHRRHGEQICTVLERLITTHKGMIARGEAPADSLLSMIVERHPKSSAAARGPGSLDLPEGTRWEDITIEIVAVDAAKILVGDQVFAVTAFDMGFKDHRKNLPNRLWDLLVDFAEERGVLSWRSEKRTRVWAKKDVQRLRNALKGFFRLVDDPFRPYDKNDGYRTRFRVLYDRTVQL